MDQLTMVQSPSFTVCAFCLEHISYAMHYIAVPSHLFYTTSAVSTCPTLSHQHVAKLHQLKNQNHNHLQQDSVGSHQQSSPTLYHLHAGPILFNRQQDKNIENVTTWSCVLNCFMLSSLPCFPGFFWPKILVSAISNITKCVLLTKI